MVRDDSTHAESWLDNARPLLWLLAWATVLLGVLVNGANATSLIELCLGVIFDVMAPIALACVVLAWHTGRYGQVAICICFVILGVLWSLSAALGSSGHGRLGAQRSVERAFSDQKRVTDDITKAEAELAGYVKLRPTVEVDGEIHALMSDPRAGGEGDPKLACAVIDGKWTKENCPKLAPLRTEAGKAKARDQLVKKLGELRDQQSKAKPVAAMEADVEAAVRSAKQVGWDLDPDTYRLVKVWFVVLMLEFVKTFTLPFVAWIATRSAPNHTKAELPVEKPQISPVAAISEPAATIPAPLALPAPAEPLQWLQELFEQRSGMPAGMTYHNGRLFGPLDAYAEASGMSKSTVERRLTRWANAGLIGQRRTKQGTEIWLIRH